MAKSELLTEEAILKLLNVRKETPTQDYRRDLPPKGHRNCAFLDLLKDLVAIANIGGGVIVFGVADNNYELKGLSTERDRKALDERDIATACETFLNRDIRFEFSFYTHKEKTFAFLAVEGVEKPLMFHKYPTCVTCGERAGQKHFTPGSTFIRDGSATVRAPDEWYMERLHDLELNIATNDNNERTLINNLPGRYAIYDTFVGRQENYEEAIELLTDNRRRVTWIQGSGGIGKTALAYRIAESVVAKTELNGVIDYVVWASAKETVLAFSGLKETKPEFTCLADIVKSIVETTGIMQLDDSLIQEVTNAQQALGRISPILESATGLLVIDNLETVQDEQVVQFLERLPGSTRALVTTRHSMDPSRASTVELEPMSINDARDLIEAEALRTNTGWICDNDAAILDVMEMSGRIPLAIRLIVPRLESQEMLRKYKSAATQREQELLDFCYRQTFVGLSADTRNLLFALSLFVDGATPQDLGFLLEIDQNNIEKSDNFQLGLEQLWHLSLMTIKQTGVGLRYEMLTLVRRFVQRELSKDAYLKQNLNSRLEQLQAARTSDIELAARKAVRDYRKTRNYKHAIAVIEDCINRAKHNIHPLIAKAEIELECGEDLKRAQQAAAAARKVAKHGGAEWAKAVKLQADAELRTGNFGRALELLSEIHQSDKDPELYLMLSEVYFEIGQRLRLEIEKAKANFRESVEYAQKALKAAIKTDDRVIEADAYKRWAFAAFEYAPGVAYQAAEKALELGSDFAADLKELRDKAILELKGIPRRDLLRVSDL